MLSFKMAELAQIQTQETGGHLPKTGPLLMDIHIGNSEFVVIPPESYEINQPGTTLEEAPWLKGEIETRAVIEEKEGGAEIIEILIDHLHTNLNALQGHKPILTILPSKAKLDTLRSSWESIKYQLKSIKTLGISEKRRRKEALHIYTCRYDPQKPPCLYLMYRISFEDYDDAAERARPAIKDLPIAMVDLQAWPNSQQIALQKVFKELGAS